MTCKDCIPYCTTIPDCLTTLGVVFAIPDEDVTVTIRDKFKNEYKSVGFTESSGLFMIDLVDDGMPEVFLNPFAGEFTLSAVDSEGDNVPLTDGIKEFECVTFKVVPTFPKKTTHYIDPENKFPTYS